MYTSVPPLAIFHINKSVDGEWWDILINCKHSVLFWLNFSLAKMLKDWLKGKEDCKNISLPSLRQNKTNMTCSEENNGHQSGPC